MTKATSIPINQLAPPPVRRDRWERYLVVPPEGGKPEGYTRVTTIAKELDSEGALGPWKAAMTSLGIIRRSGLRTRWEALMAQYNDDPWYMGGKRECKTLVEECADAGGASDRRDVGSALHAITAVIDEGRTPTSLTEETKRDIDAYVKTRDNAGITLVPGYIETQVVLDHYKVAGTFDRLVNVPNFNLPLIADLKTGADLAYGQHSIAVQMSAYAHGDCVYCQGPDNDGSKDRRTPLPDINQDYGLIFWVASGSGTCELILVDLNIGWEGFTQSMWVRLWHKTKPFTEYTDLDALLEASLRARGISPAPLSAPLTPPNQVTEPPAPAKEPADIQGEVRDWLQERIDAIGQHDKARKGLQESWPTDLPTLRSPYEHTSDELARIEEVLDTVERRNRLAFPSARPAAADEALILSLFPGATEISEDSQLSPLTTNNQKGNNTHG